PRAVAEPDSGARGQDGRGDAAARRARRRAPARDAHLALLPRRAGRRDDARLRHARGERHLLVSALEEDLLARRRRNRPRRAVRVLRRRAGRRRLMTFDPELANRIRALLGDRVDDEKKVFGGLAFMIGGNMAVAASSNGGIIVRVDPAEGPELAETTPAELMEMRGKQM